MSEINITEDVMYDLDLPGIIDVLYRLNKENPVDWRGDLDTLCTQNIASIEVKLPIIESLAVLDKYNPNDYSGYWKYISLNIFYLRYLGNALEEKSNFCLSVQQIKSLKNIIRNVIGLGISSNLLPSLPYHTKLTSYGNNLDDFIRYKRLVGTTYGIWICVKFRDLRPVIISTYLKWILCALYQILYCPIKKPTIEPDKSGFVMTQDIHNTLMSNRSHFEPFLNELGASTHTVLYIRETMKLPMKDSPMWLKKSVTFNLNKIIRSPKGVEKVAWAMLDAASVNHEGDSIKSWKIVDIIAKIIMDSRKFPDFKENICRQVYGLLTLRYKDDEAVKPFEGLFTLCAKLLYHQDKDLCRETFIRPLLRPLISFSDENEFEESIFQIMRISRLLFVEGHFNAPLIPAVEFTVVLSVAFRIYAVTFNNDGLKNFNEDIRTVLLGVLRDLGGDRIFSAFDSLLFDLKNDTFSQLRNDLEILIENDCLKIRQSDYKVVLRPLARANVLSHLLKENVALTTTFFTYLLSCLINADTYFNVTVNRDLIHLESELILDEAAERKLAVYQLLSELSENKAVQKHMNENPDVVVSYIRVVFEKILDNRLHTKSDCESEEFQSAFVVVMLLQVLVENSLTESLVSYEVLKEPLEVITKECTDAELKTMSKNILLKLRGNVGASKFDSKPTTSEETELEKALEDICDPLLPVRGHGVMMLAKLVETRDKRALERKNFILNVFQQNLKNEDSFIYLNAIRGLTAMADVFPDTVLNVLAEEYSDFSRKDSEDGHETRMKLGESLMCAVRILGDMAPKYKTLLLNTFLVGTKDDDHLIRTSSLSNLGEICRVLGYKLGSIVTEVLVCVHAIITTDKAIEPRRAAVTVIRQLFVGLEKEMIVFLKDEILPIYRTLKHIYYYDADDVMRLQAQLALEQLNENMRDFVFPSPQIFSHKKFVIQSSE